MVNEQRRHVAPGRLADELRRLADMIPPDASVMFNNLPRVGDAKRFKDLLARAVGVAERERGR